MIYIAVAAPGEAELAPIARRRMGLFAVRRMPYRITCRQQLPSMTFCGRIPGIRRSRLHPSL
jgi:hypothetical protein